jgi:ankyrin repeat protein
MESRRGIGDFVAHTALLWAAGSGKAEVVRLLLDKGAKTEYRDEWGHHSAFEWAASQGRV